MMSPPQSSLKFTARQSGGQIQQIPSQPLPYTLQREPCSKIVFHFVTVAITNYRIISMVSRLSLACGNLGHNGLNLAGRQSIRALTTALLHCSVEPSASTF